MKAATALLAFAVLAVLTATVTLASPPRPGSVTPAVLNVRSGPGATYPIVGQLRAGNSVSVLARNAAGDWLYVCCVPGSRRHGWVATRYVVQPFDPATVGVYGQPLSPLARPTPGLFVSPLQPRGLVRPPVATPAARLFLPSVRS